MEIKTEYKVEITQQIIDNSNVWDYLNCYAVNALKTIPEFKDKIVGWGLCDGFVEDGVTTILLESRKETGGYIDMTDIEHPTTVIFKRID